MSSKLFNVYAESEDTFWTMNENDEYKWEGRVGVGRHCLLVLLVSPAAALHIMPLPHQSAHMLRRAEHNGHRTTNTSQLPGQWMEEEEWFSWNGSGKNIPWIIWKFISSPSDSGADCRLAILETYSEIYLSGRMRTVLLKWQYEPWNMVLFLPQPCHHSSLVPPSTKTLI